MSAQPPAYGQLCVTSSNECFPVWVLLIESRDERMNHVKVKQRNSAVDTTNVGYNSALVW
jgi:hypothetical protein